jgi:hypothetical protein
MTRSKWMRVSKKSPCPICKHGEWCSLSSDEKTVKCMRVRDGCFRAKQDCNGAEYYLHRLDAGIWQFSVDPIPPTSAGQERAVAEQLHTVYSSLLSRLGLAAAHHEDLQRRGLTDEAIDQGGYRSLPGKGRTAIAKAMREKFGDRIFNVPGFVLKEGANGKYVTLKGAIGMVIPCRDSAGRIVALKVRRDGDGEGSRYFYVSSTNEGGPGPGSPIHHPHGTPLNVELARITEGELKADVIFALTSVPTLSVPGASSWRMVLQCLKDLGAVIVRVAFDMDVLTNRRIADALIQCINALRQEGFQVELERWNPADGKGLDDLLAAGKTPEILTGEKVDAQLCDLSPPAEEPTAEEGASSNDLATRIKEKLRTDGPEAFFVDRPLLQELAALQANDLASYAAIRTAIRGQISVRDLDGILKSLQPPSERTTDVVPNYFVNNGCICRHQMTPDGPLVVPLCNFDARIVEDVVHDDGVEQTRTFAIEGSLAGGPLLEKIDVLAADFTAMNWVVREWGTSSVPYAGMSTKDHLRVAIQILSGQVPTRVKYKHLGWRKIGNEWVFLHAGGAIGAKGLDTAVPVVLPDALERFCLPPPPAGQLLASPICASLRFLELGPDALMFPVLAAVYRAVLGNTDFGLFLAGPTGSFKTELAALAQQHFGAGMDARHLPANWSSTGNALEAIAFATKDSLLVVDDFCPVGAISDVARLHKEADRLFRGQGNHSGRQRLSSKADLRSAKSPRGLVLSTGEDVPKGQSLRARLLTREVAPGDIDIAVLTACQKDASDGLFAAAMAGFVQSLAPRFDAIQANLLSEHASLRSSLQASDAHARTPGIAADLCLGLQYFLDFAVASKAIDRNSHDELWHRGRAAIVGAAQSQTANIASAEPAAMFLNLLLGVLASGRGHIANCRGGAPPFADRWGWRAKSGTEPDWTPLGDCIGWMEGDDIYLEPEAAYAAAQLLAKDQGDSFPISNTTLRRRLKEKGWLASFDEGRGRLTVRRMIHEIRREVVHLLSSLFLAETVPTVPTVPIPSNSAENPHAAWDGSRPDHMKPSHKPSHENGPFPNENLDMGLMGRLGRSDSGVEPSAPAHSNSEFPHAQTVSGNREVTW